MSMLARYKRGGGIIELVKLIEDSPEPKRTQLLNMVRSEDTEFAAQVEAKIFNYEKLRLLPESILAEIIASTSPKHVALALVGEEAAFVTLCERCLGKNFSEYKAEKDSMAQSPPAAGQIEAGRRKLVAEARKLEAAGSIKLISPEAEASMAGSSGGEAKSLSSAGPASAPAGSASEESGCPPIESFALEPPPPGLSGERFDTFLKQVLGLQ
jgi:flagellar motor switch protein FliG